jgi:NTE family protein
MPIPIRIALSGSGFRLPAHVGALKAVLDADYKPVEISATSGGAIVASFYAAGISLTDMQELALTMDWSPMMRFSPWTLLTKQALCDGDALLDLLTKHTEGKTFAALGADRSGGPGVGIYPDRVRAGHVWPGDCRRRGVCEQRPRKRSDGR